MSVRAKFTCLTITHEKDQSHVNLFPVTNGSEENKQFYRWTPGGNINLSVLRRETADAFIPGEEYYVDFTRVEKEQNTD